MSDEGDPRHGPSRATEKVMQPCPQRYLDPRTADEVLYSEYSHDVATVDQAVRIVRAKIPKYLSKHVRKFGALPNIEHWQPGDLILLCATVCRPTPILVAAAQEAWYRTEDARWHHAAVYLGDYMICEAPFKGRVRAERIYDRYVGRHLIRVRRPRGGFPKRLGDEDGHHLGYDVARQAMIALGMPYDKSDFWRLGRAARRECGWLGSLQRLASALWQRKKKIGIVPQTSGPKRDVVSPDVFGEERIICGEFYSRAFEHATKKSLSVRMPSVLRKDADDKPPVNPAALSETDDLEDVSVEWVKIPS